jgi:nucleotide-binding universal stress UspA family protein
MTTAPSIVVGIDGGQASIAALQAAIREAALRGTTVTALTCWPSDDRRDDAGPLLCNTYEQATEVMEHVINEATRRDPDHGVTIVRRISQSYAGPSLVEASRHAELVVLGSTTRGTLGRHHGKQTIEHCLRYASSPVLVVPWTAASLDEVDIDTDLHLRSSAG